MLKTILVYGLIAGVIVAIPMLLQATVLNGHPPLAWSMVVGYATMLIALSAVFIGIKRYRDVQLGGVIRFWPALALGLGISVVASVMYVFAWEITVAVTHMDFATGYANALIKQKQAARRDGSGAGAVRRRDGQVQNRLRQSVFPSADDVHRNLSGRRAGDADFRGAVAQRARASGAAARGVISASV